MSKFNLDGKVFCDYCPFDKDMSKCSVFVNVLSYNPYSDCPTEETYDEIMKSLGETK